MVQLFVCCVSDEGFSNTVGIAYCPTFGAFTKFISAFLLVPFGRYIACVHDSICSVIAKWQFCSFVYVFIVLPFGFDLPFVQYIMLVFADTVPRVQTHVAAAASQATGHGIYAWCVNGDTASCE